MFASGSFFAASPEVVFDTFDLIDPVTAASAPDVISTLISNTLTFAEDDMLVAIGASAVGSVRTFETPTPNWGTPGETWTERVDDSAVVGSSYFNIGVATAPAAAAQTSETVDIIFSGGMFGLIAAFIRVQRDTIIRQVSPVAKVEGTGTSISTTFSTPILSTSQILSLCGQRVNTDAIVNPSGFTELFNASATSSSRLRGAARIGHTSDTVSWSGLSSTNLAKIAVSIEFARPGQEI